MPTNYTPHIAICARCGGRFSVKKPYLARIRKHCSRACRDAARRTRVERACETCGARFAAHAYAVAAGLARYCSRPCWHEALRDRDDPIRRVWLSIVRGAPDDCWPWTGHRNANGYGELTIGRRRWRAHRVVLQATLGRPLAAGEWALHTCDNPPCCNPAHLYAGSPRDNARDRVERGRQRSPFVPGHAVTRRRARHVSGSS